MHRDKKIGFALGILLLGIVAAFFFRNEPDPFAELPPLDDPAALDGQIAEKPNAPYTEEAPTAARPSSSRGSQWELPEIYRPREARPSGTGLYASPAAPAPINLGEPTAAKPSGSTGVIEVRDPFSESLSTPKNQTPPGNENWTTVPKPPETRPAKSVVKNRKEAPSTPLTTYQIKKGDTLSDLAESHLGSSRRYMEIYEANKDKLRSPDDIQVGMTIRIPPRVKFNGAGVQKAPEKKRQAENTSLDSPRPQDAGRFRPFSRSPLGPVPF